MLRYCSLFSGSSGNCTYVGNAEGGILLLTTHDVMELQLCDAWYIIKDGVLVPFVYDGDLNKLVESL